MMNKILWISPEQTEAKVDLSIVTVPWNSAECLKGLAQSLKESVGTSSCEWIIVDNDSKDQSLEIALSVFPEAVCIQNGANLGFAKANNIGKARARGRHLLLLNPDMTVEPEALQRTIDTLDMYPDIGVLSGKLLTNEGKILYHTRRFPKIHHLLFTLLKIARLFPSTMRWYMGEDLDVTKSQNVDSVRGSYFAIHQHALNQIGGLDERYFLWFEEVDYCQMVHKAGLRVYYEPSIVAHDQLSRSFAQRESTWKNRVFSASMILYVQKWHSSTAEFFIRIAAKISYGMTWMVEKLSKLWKK